MGKQKKATHYILTTKYLKQSHWVEGQKLGGCNSSLKSKPADLKASITRLKVYSVTQASLVFFTRSLPGCQGSLHLSTSEARAARQGRAAHSAPAQVPKERARSACHTALNQTRHGHGGTGTLPAARYRGRDGAQETRPLREPGPRRPGPGPRPPPAPQELPPAPEAPRLTQKMRLRKTRTVLEEVMPHCPMAPPPPPLSPRPRSAPLGSAPPPTPPPRDPSEQRQWLAEPKMAAGCVTCREGGGGT